MKIAILTSGIMPVPAVQGGAVETLVDFYLAYNDQHHLHDITVYSVWHPAVEKQGALRSSVNHYHYVKIDGWWAKLRKRLYQATHGEEYYHYTIEYFLERALSHLRRQHYDLVILENRPGYALKVSRATRSPLVYHLHNDFLNRDSRHAAELYELAARIITVSDFIADRVRTVAPHDTKCMTVHNGIDTRAFSPKVAPVSLEAVNEGDFVVVFSGRINSEKGIMQLIAAMSLVARNRAVKLLVMGSSFYANASNDNPFAQRLREMADPIRDRIIFTGFIPYADMPRYLRLADVAVLPSVWDEPFGLTMVEAQAMGLPLVTTRRGGIPEVVTPESAILLDTDEHFVDRLAAAIIDLYDHPEKRRLMGQAAIASSERFNNLRYAENFFKAIGSVR